MKYTENALNILTAKSYKDIGKAWIVKNLRGNETVEEIVSLIGSKSQVTKEDFEYKRAQFEKLLQKFKGVCDGIVALGDYDFPRYRGNVTEGERPVFLYYKGNIELLNIENKNISVIGLLNPEGDIEERERRLVAELVGNGATIVSGLAFGCDSVAHRQALDSNGKTVAILPSPLDNILPARNEGLAYEIVEAGGLLVTEYGNDFKSTMELSGRYKERDRLQALFCDAIILAASYSLEFAQKRKNLNGQKFDSGARLAMDYAKKYNISRAVMYDETSDSGNPMFGLNKQLIEEQPDISVISRDNLTEAVKRIVAKNSGVKGETNCQTSLF